MEISMKYIEQQTQYIRNILYPVIGETKAKIYFSYYAIFKNKLMIGLYKNEKFYLRASQSFLDEIQNSDGVVLLSDSQIGIHAKNFYLIPSSILENLNNYSHWIYAIIHEMIQQQQIISTERKDLIRTLPNMNIRIERILKKLGITSVNELISKGEIDIFIELIKIGVEANDTFLFKLYGAINHKYIHTLTPTEKSNLLSEANQALYQAGLRKRFPLN